MGGHTILLFFAFNNKPAFRVTVRSNASEFKKGLITKLILSPVNDVKRLGPRILGS